MIEMPNHNTPPRYMSTPQLYAYTSLHRPTAEKLAERAGARIKVDGARRVLYDREKLDAYLDKLSEGDAAEGGEQ